MARARESWARSLAAIAPVAQSSDDYQFLEPYAFALLENNRTDEASMVIQKLDTMGFLNPRLLAAATERGLRLRARPVTREGKEE